MPEYLQDNLIDPKTKESHFLIRSKRDGLNARIRSIGILYTERKKAGAPEEELWEILHDTRLLVEERDLLDAKLIGLQKITARYDPDPKRTQIIGRTMPTSPTYFKRNPGSAKPRGD